MHVIHRKWLQICVIEFQQCGHLVMLYPRAGYMFVQSTHTWLQPFWFGIVYHSLWARAAMAEEPPSKVARLQSMRHQLPYMSQRALAAVTKELRDAPLEGSADRRTIRKARDSFAAQMTPYGTLHQKVTLEKTSGGAIDVEFLAPLAWLHTACASAAPCSNLVAQSLRNHPSTHQRPWGMIVYSDEVSPGNQLLSDNARKVQVVYFSFREFGAAALADEEAWWVACVVRSTIVNSLLGGMSALIGAFLKLSFDPAGHNARTAGVALRLHGGELARVWYTFAFTVADESALKQTWRCKGASGTKPCLLCMNVVQHKPRNDMDPLVEHDGTGALVSACAPSLEGVVPHTKATIRRVLEHLRRAKEVMGGDGF